MEPDFGTILAVKQLLTQQQAEPWLADIVYDSQTDSDLLSILSTQLDIISQERQREREKVARHSGDAPLERESDSPYDSENATRHSSDSPSSDVSTDDASSQQKEVRVLFC
jgi:hypothetical protein